VIVSTLVVHNSTVQQQKCVYPCSCDEGLGNYNSKVCYRVTTVVSIDTDWMTHMQHPHGNVNINRLTEKFGLMESVSVTLMSILAAAFMTPVMSPVIHIPAI
jgi:hypothetical protein